MSYRRVSEGLSPYPLSPEDPLSGEHSQRERRPAQTQAVTTVAMIHNAVKVLGRLFHIFCRLIRGTWAQHLMGLAHTWLAESITSMIM